MNCGDVHKGKEDNMSSIMRHSSVASPREEAHHYNGLRSRAATVVDTHAGTRNPRNILDHRDLLSSVKYRVVVRWAKNDGAHHIFNTTVTDQRGNITILNRRFGDFRQLHEKVRGVRYFFIFILHSLICLLFIMFALNHAGAKRLQTQALLREPLSS